ncbi:MAG: AgmX/PglI C-terminal domain-containing protein [Myxococcales bacterium]|nr:AgmX/PglI C-terminal domain-containing protein [Myxococcales bacterium]
MKHLVTLTAVTALFTGCLGQPEATPAEAGAAPSAVPSAAPVSKVALEVEQAIRNVDVGKSLGEARATLEASLGDATLSDDLRDEATLALARARDALGDREAAITTVEGLLEKRVDKHPWRFEDAADALLQKLVSGGAQPSLGEADEGSIVVSPFARALTPFFPVQEGAVKVSLLQFGAPTDADELGTFAVVDAVRAKAREACPLCDKSPSGHTSSSRHGSWTSIPAQRARLDRSLVVFFFDLGAHKIPARYDAYLPLPSAEVIGRLEKGEGLVVVKSRPGAPPVILLGAPREAQLPDVQKALAAMTEIPAAPVAVPLTANLRPREIKAVMRSARGAMKKCVEEHAPKADGTLKLRFDVKEDGTVANLTTKPEGEGVSDAAFLACIDKAAGALTFPKTGQKLTVAYPIRVTK